MKKLFHIIHYKYGDICGDPYYGKDGKIVSVDTVCCSEQVVKVAVNLLNKFNGSFWAKEITAEMENELDYSEYSDYFDEDYFYYEEVGVTTSVVNLVKKYDYKRKWRAGKL